MNLFHIKLTAHFHPLEGKHLRFLLYLGAAPQPNVFDVNIKSLYYLVQHSPQNDTFNKSIEENWT